MMQKGADITFYLAKLAKPYISLGPRERPTLTFCDGLYHWVVIPEVWRRRLAGSLTFGVSFDVAHDRLGHRILPDKVKLEELGINVLQQQRGKDGKCDICEKAAKHHHIFFPEGARF